MAQLERGTASAIAYDHSPPTGGPDAVTFVFINPITGDKGQWEALIAPRVRSAGHGTLAYNLRGQADSPLPVQEPLTDETITGDLAALVEHVAPLRPVYVGLSIGGLFAARAILGGAPAAGLVLLNTLRAPSKTLDWTNEAILRAAQLGGPRLVGDLFMPMLLGPGTLADRRADALQAEPYAAAEPDDAVVRLLTAGRDSDWTLDWSQLSLPVLIVTGAQDRVFRQPNDIAALAAMMPQARTEELPDAGHLLQLEAPDTVANLLLDFATALT
ncbi:MAG: alpha/beta hydrolase [Pseudomonadota bacterium]